MEVEETDENEPGGENKDLTEVETAEEVIAEPVSIEEAAPEVIEKLDETPVVEQPKPKFERNIEPAAVEKALPEEKPVIEQPVPKPIEIKEEETDIEGKSVEEEVIEKPKPAAVKEEKSKVKEKSKAEQKPAKKVDFEITNPNDIEIDDKGQLGLF